MAIAEMKWKLVKDTYFFDTTTCYLSENGNHMFYSGGEKRIKILIDDLNELVRKGCAMWLKLGEYEFALDKLSKCPTTTWYSINQMLYSLEPWGVMKESKESARKSMKENKRNFSVYDFIDYMIKMKCIDGIMDNINFSITQEDFNYALNDLGYDFKIIKKENPHDSINGVRYYIYQYQIDDEIYRVWIDEKYFVLDACLKY